MNTIFPSDLHTTQKVGHSDEYTFWMSISLLAYAILLSYWILQSWNFYRIFLFHLLFNYGFVDKLKLFTKLLSQFSHKKPITDIGRLAVNALVNKINYN